MQQLQYEFCIEPYLYHGIKLGDTNKLIEIINSGFILPKKEIVEYKNPNPELISFNGDSWISLSQKSLIEDENGEAAFDMFIYNHPCFVIRHGIKGLNYTSYLNKDDYYNLHSYSVRNGKIKTTDVSELIKEFLEEHSETRYSSYIDEVQTNVPISMKEIIAVGVPKDATRDEDIERVRRTLEEAQMNVPILDSSRYDFADNQICMKKSKIL